MHHHFLTSTLTPPPPPSLPQVLLVMMGSLQQLHDQATAALEHLQHRWTASRRTSAAGGPPSGSNSAASLPGGNAFSYRANEAIDTMLAQAQDSCSRAVEQVGVGAWPAVSAGRRLSWCISTDLHAAWLPNHHVQAIVLPCLSAC